MTTLIDSKIEELVQAHGYDAQVLRDFAAFVQTQPKPRKPKSVTSTSKSKPAQPKSTKPKALSIKDIQAALIADFGCEDLASLKKHESFKLAIAGRNLKSIKKDDWLNLYREWIGVPKNEQQEEGPTCINGIDVLKNFRPWHVFNLDPKTATSDDINSAFRQLAKQHHPDHGGDRQVFEQLQKMRDSLLAFR